MLLAALLRSAVILSATTFPETIIPSGLLLPAVLLSEWGEAHECVPCQVHRVHLHVCEHVKHVGVEGESTSGPRLGDLTGRDLRGSGGEKGDGGEDYRVGREDEEWGCRGRVGDGKMWGWRFQLRIAWHVNACGTKILQMNSSAKG